MGKLNFSEAFKRDAVAQITERGYPVAEVSQRLGVSAHSLYAWKRQLGRQVSSDASKDAEIRQLKRELARVTEERDILKKATAYFARDAKGDTRSLPSIVITLACGQCAAASPCSLAFSLLGRRAR